MEKHREATAHTENWQVSHCLSLMHFIQDAAEEYDRINVKSTWVYLGKSWGVNKHQKTGEEQMYSVSKNGRKRLIRDLSISQLAFKCQKILESTKSL